MWLDQFVHQCQLCAGQFALSDWSSLIKDVRSVIDGVPLTLCMSDQLLVRQLMGRLLGRMVLRADIDRQGETVRDFVSLVASDMALERWLVDFVRILDRCKLFCENTGSADARTHNRNSSHVKRALLFIDGHYTDSLLSLLDLATAINLSPWHASRVLKAGTGDGFREHVRRRRLFAADHLLTTTSLKLKAIAVKVGYCDASQFSRDFRQAYGVTPKARRTGW